MRVFKYGFTMAEALVSMAIIGVVAAITIPQVVQNTLKNEAGAVLGRTIEQIETGCQNMIQKANDNITVYDGGYYEGLSSLTTKEVFGTTDSKPFKGDGLFAYGGAFFGSVPFTGDDKYASADAYITSIKNFKGEGQRISAGTTAYILEKQKAIIIPNGGAAEVAGVNDFTTAIFVDINGTDKPNRGGKDVFLFALSNGGKMIPAGTKLYQKYATSIPLHTADCKNGAVNGGWSCAARVVKDGFRITYY